MMIRLMKKCPLLLLLIFSTLLLELWAVWGGLTGKYKWKITVDKPLFATVHGFFSGMQRIWGNR